MTILYRFGSRLYEFDSRNDLVRAISIYIRSCENLDGFEKEMEDVGIQFNYEEGELYGT